MFPFVVAAVAGIVYCAEDNIICEPTSERKQKHTHIECQNARRRRQESRVCKHTTAFA